MDHKSRSSLLDRPQRSTSSASSTRTRERRSTPTRSSQYSRLRTQSSQDLSGSRSKYGRTGSKQNLSHRGRRVVQPKPNPGIIRMLIMVTVVLAGAIAAAMGLSVYTTEQTFHLQNLKNTDAALTNQIETLQRDLERKRSAAAIAEHAQDDGMVVPNIPGILESQADGTVAQTRDPDTQETRPITDVNANNAQAAEEENNAARATLVPTPSSTNSLPYGIRSSSR